MNETAMIRDPLSEIEKLKKQVDMYRNLWKQATEREKYWQDKYYQLHDGLLNLVRKDDGHASEVGCDRQNSL